jgi:large subunit ribosomal protein L6
MLIKKLKLNSSKSKFFFVSIEDSKFLVLDIPSYKKMYISVRPFVSIFKEEDHLVLKLKKKNRIKDFAEYVEFFSRWLKNVEKPFKKQLVLKGLGFKADLTEDSKNLELKLGFSLIITLPIPIHEVKVSVNKNVLTFEGFDPVAVGNFATKVKSLKFPDAYKGKGFWDKNEVRALKEIKKT